MNCKVWWEMATTPIIPVDVANKKKKTRSNVRKPCVRFRGHIFSPIIMKLGRHICLHEISEEFENGSCRVIS